MGIFNWLFDKGINKDIEKWEKTKEEKKKIEEYRASPKYKRKEEQDKRKEEQEKFARDLLNIRAEKLLDEYIEKRKTKEWFIEATGKSDEEFEKFWQGYVDGYIEKTLSNFKKKNEGYAFPKEALTIIDELTYIGEEKKIFNGYEIIETFDDGKPKKIVKYKDGKRTNEYKEHPFDFKTPKP